MDLTSFAIGQNNGGGGVAYTAGKGIQIADHVISAKVDTTDSCIQFADDGTWKLQGFTGATNTEAGKQGLVPVPSPGDNTKYLRGDGTWALGSSLQDYIETIQVQDAGEGADGRLTINGYIGNVAFTDYFDASVVWPVEATAGAQTLDYVNINGIIYRVKDTEYTLPTATTSALGGVKVDGTTITISDGVISSVGGGGSEPAAYIKSASVSGNTLTLTNKDNTTVPYTPTVPTKTSDLTNDSGFLTSHQSLADYSTTTEMNTAISNHHDSQKMDAIAVTAADNGKVLMVVNGAWAVADLPKYDGSVE